MNETGSAISSKALPNKAVPSKALPSKRLRLIVLWVVFLVLDTMAQIIFKLGGAELESTDGIMGFASVALHSPMVWLAIICYIVMFFLWMLILQKMEVSQAFPLTGLTYVTVPLSAYYLLHETFDWQRGVGIGIIIMGVILLGSEG